MPSGLLGEKLCTSPAMPVVSSAAGSNQTNMRNAIPPASSAPARRLSWSAACRAASTNSCLARSTSTRPCVALETAPTIATALSESDCPAGAVMQPCLSSLVCEPSLPAPTIASRHRDETTAGLLTHARPAPRPQAAWLAERGPRDTVIGRRGPGAPAPRRHGQGSPDL
jgi:hypothetical protein